MPLCACVHACLPAFVCARVRTCVCMRAVDRLHRTRFDFVVGIAAIFVDENLVPINMPVLYMYMLEHCHEELRAALEHAADQVRILTVPQYRFDEVLSVLPCYEYCRAAGTARCPQVCGTMGQLSGLSGPVPCVHCSCSGIGFARGVYCATVAHRRRMPINHSCAAMSVRTVVLCGRCERVRQAGSDSALPVIPAHSGTGRCSSTASTARTAPASSLR